MARFFLERNYPNNAARDFDGEPIDVVKYIIRLGMKGYNWQYLGAHVEGWQFPAIAEDDLIPDALNDVNLVMQDGDLICRRCRTVMSSLEQWHDHECQAKLREEKPAA